MRGAPRKRGEKTSRRTLFDSLTTADNANLYCDVADLTNEASVEAFFVSRMLKDLDYRDSQIKTKHSIESLTVSFGGAKGAKYKPDYVLVFRARPRWIIDAKSPEENLDKWVAQCGGYCLGLNGAFGSGENPVRHFMLTNGLETRVYPWDSKEPILVLSFADFVAGRPKYEQLRALLAPSSLVTPHIVDSHNNFRFHRPTTEEAKAIFAQCHRLIWMSEGRNPTAAFMEFTKLMFVKLWCDRQLRADPEVKALLIGSDEAKLPKNSVVFSLHWIQQREHESATDNPVNDILFKTLREDIEEDIAYRKKKRIFGKDEQIALRPDTVKAVVGRLQHFDMFGIDEDLNGRLFETFLSATMRGRELGQYFTPRSIVKMMTGLAGLKAQRGHVDKALDACCGTGGFLIEVLTDLRNQIRANESLTDTEKVVLVDRICNEAIYGIDFGKEPPIARIARINMYLHGDGGSRVYEADALDKELTSAKGTEVEEQRDVEELREKVAKGLRFDVALTNPPFSMKKELENETEGRILRQYELAKVPGTSKYKPSLRSNVMFLERYHDLLAPGGRLLTVIDDTLLASKDNYEVRAFIRDRFIVRAIVSLPGDAFKRSGARVKTSVLCLEKKRNAEERQASVFVAFAQHLGVDDLTHRAWDEEVVAARQRAEEESKRITGDFRRFMAGDSTVDCVPPDRIQDRLDLKSVVPLKGRLIPKWRANGIEVKRLGEIVEERVEILTPRKSMPEEDFTVIQVSYAGFCEVQKRCKGKSIKYEKMKRVRAGDILSSEIRASDGAIGIVPHEMDGAIVSLNFAVLQCPDEVDSIYLWSVLRTSEIRADLMSPSTGTGRYRTDSGALLDLQVPWVPRVEREKLCENYKSCLELEREITRLRQSARDSLARLEVETEESKRRLASYKPPQ